MSRPQSNPKPTERASVSQPPNAEGPAPEALNEESGAPRFVLTNVLPSWMVSLITHVLLVVMLALFILPGPENKTVSFDAAEVAGEQLDSPNVDFSEMELDASALDASEFSESEEMSLLNPQESQVLELDTANPLADLLASPLESISGESQGQLESASTSGATNGRSDEMRERMLKKYGGTPDSENAVMLALAWLAQHQLDDGSWSFDHTAGPGSRSTKNPGDLRLARNGATAMALLCFLGNGQTHQQGQYKEAVGKGLEFLLANGVRTANGRSYWEDGGTMYSHGLCSIVLCEAYAMTEDSRLRQPAQEAIQFIEFFQHPLGGWRYEPQQPGDTSVAGWQIMALKSAVNCGLQVNPKTFKLAERFLDSISIDYGAIYGYMEPPEARTRTFRGRTAVGVLCRMYMGWEREHRGIQDAVAWMGGMGPSPDTPEDRRNNSCNMYYNYYATQVMMQIGGPTWEKWNAAMRDFLVQMQSQDGNEKGSWFFPQGELGVDRGGRLYCTCLAALTLEVYYRYLPLYDKSAFEETFPLD